MKKKTSPICRGQKQAELAERATANSVCSPPQQSQNILDIIPEVISRALVLYQK